MEVPPQESQAKAGECLTRSLRCCCCRFLMGGQGGRDTLLCSYLASAESNYTDHQQNTPMRTAQSGRIIIFLVDAECVKLAQLFS